MLRLTVDSPDLAADGRVLISEIPTITRRASIRATNAGVAEARRSLARSGVFRQGRSAGRVTSRPGWIRIGNRPPNITAFRSTRFTRRPSKLKTDAEERIQRNERRRIRRRGRTVRAGGGPGRQGIRRGSRRVPGGFLHRIGGERGPRIGFYRTAAPGQRFRGTGGVDALRLPVTRTSIKAREEATPIVDQVMKEETERLIQVNLRRRLRV